MNLPMRRLAFTFRSCLVLILLEQAASFAQTQWTEVSSSNYSIFYQPGYEKDGEFTRTWLTRAEELLKSKYGVPYHGFNVSVYLYPAPTERANVGLANLQCCTSSTDGIRKGTISYLSPPAAEWRNARGATSLGLPKDENYHAKVIMSEYITVGHYVVQESRQKTGGWRYRTAPEWFIQGLQEYDGIFHTTETNRNLTAARLLDWARSRPSVFACCSSGLSISDSYNGGAAFMAFLAAQFGEDIHARLLRDTASSFDAAFANQTQPYTLPQLFAKFQMWLSAAGK
jgi:hypothetical protein